MTLAKLKKVDAKFGEYCSKIFDAEAVGRKII